MQTRSHGWTRSGTRYTPRYAPSEAHFWQAEANAIGTEYVRADLLPGADAAKVRALLRRYTDQRILFYETGDREKLLQINASTAQLQSELWSAVRAPAATQATPVLALAISGMSEVLNSQGYTQAAWWDRIPLAAWGMMAAIAICANLLVGYGARQAKIFRADSGDDATCHRLGFFPDF